MDSGTANVVEYWEVLVKRLHTYKAKKTSTAATITIIARNDNFWVLMILLSPNRLRPNDTLLLRSITQHLKSQDLFPKKSMILHGQRWNNTKSSHLDFLNGLDIKSSFGDLLLIQGFYICNPLTKQWVAIPEAPKQDSAVERIKLLVSISLLARYTGRLQWNYLLAIKLEEILAFNPFDEARLGCPQWGSDPRMRTCIEMLVVEWFEGDCGYRSPLSTRTRLATCL
ncbi:hypothetical protein PanWU01x14_233110 [Parasponia andersonii]|uniref:Uncharacterized protein n=1 Tax=Parasponia andersonii TaxID=3476 RepID=A0A2P5BJS4_PARAD|nr:hypothetical protein PanWU01x14_233110 [Parasponia andersonii]